MLTDSLKNIVWPPSRNNLSMEVKTTIVGRPLTREKGSTGIKTSTSATLSTTDATFNGLVNVVYGNNRCLSEIHTKHINTLCRQNVELLNVKPGGTYSDHWALRG